jgi:lysozyme
MKLSQRGLDLIISFEGYHTRLADGRCKAYLDRLPKKPIWTIGYGCTEGIYEGLIWTEQQAREGLDRELDKHEEFVRQIVTVPMNQNEFDALVSFCYNCGPNNLSNLVDGRLNKNKRGDTAKAFHLYNKSGGKPYRGLTRRRAAEAALFAEPIAEELEASPHMPQSVDAAKEPMSANAKATIGAAAGTAGTAVVTSPPAAVTDTLTNVEAWQSAGKTAVALSTAAWSNPVLILIVGGLALAAIFVLPKLRGAQ